MISFTRLGGGGKLSVDITTEPRDMPGPTQSCSPLGVAGKYWLVAMVIMYKDEKVSSDGAKDPKWWLSLSVANQFLLSAYCSRIL